MNRSSSFALLLLCVTACSAVDGGDDEAIPDVQDGQYNTAIIYPDPRVLAYGEPGAPYGHFGSSEGVVYPDDLELEWPPYMHASPPLPAYPLELLPAFYPRGVPSGDFDSLVHGADFWPSNYNLTRGGGFGAWGIPAAQHRSWYIGNFAVYVPTVEHPIPTQLPAMHPRPAGLVNLALQLTPLTAGKVSAIGVPCNRRKVGDWELGPYHATSPQLITDEHHDCRDFVEAKTSPVSAAFAMVPEAYAVASESAYCLDGGGDGVTDVPLDERLAWQLSDPQRNGLVWLNMGELDEILELIQAVSNEGGFGEAAAEVIAEANEWLESADNALLNPTGFTYPHFTDTGVCGFLARIGTASEYVDGEWETVLATHAGCPAGHYAVFEPFDIDTILGSANGAVDGYCAIPWSQFDVGANDPNYGASQPAVLPPSESWGRDTPEGVSMYTLNGDVVDATTVLGWASLVTYEPTDDGWALRSVAPRCGTMACGTTAFGDALLSAFGLQSGDVLIGVDSIVSLRERDTATSVVALQTAVCGSDRDCLDAAAETPFDHLLLEYVDQRLAAWQVVTLWVQRGSTMIPTYVRVRPEATASDTE